MTVVELVKSIGLLLAGGGGLHILRFLYRTFRTWQNARLANVTATALAAKTEAEARVVEVDAALDVGAGVRKDITFALAIQREQIASLHTEVVTSREENRKLLTEHTACQLALATFEVDLKRRDLEVRTLRDSLAETRTELATCQSQLREAFGLLRERSQGFEASDTIRGDVRTPAGGISAGVDGPNTPPR